MTEDYTKNPSRLPLLPQDSILSSHEETKTGKESLGEQEAPIAKAHWKSKADSSKDGRKRGAEAGSKERVEAVAAAIHPEEIEELIEQAKMRAETGDHDDSQSAFHRKVSSLLEKAFGGSSNTTLDSLGDAIHSILMLCESSTTDRPSTSTGKRELFPLPVPEGGDGASHGQSFLTALTSSLNSLNGQGLHGTKTAASDRVLKRLTRVLRETEFLHQPLPTMDFKEFFQTRGVDYQGEEVKLARRISWEEVRHSLPDQVAMLDIRDFCHGGVLHYVTHFEEYLVASEDQVIGRTPDVMIQEGQWPTIVQGLLERGVCKVLPKSQVHHVQNRPLLSGMFSVSKQEFVGNTEVCRLIMNFKPLNLNCRSLAGDTGTLPSVQTMGALYLAEDELLCISSEDIRCFFYLFRVPQDWCKYMAFGRTVPEDLLPPGFPAEPGYLCSRVLPMGFCNSVAVAQHIHRQVVRRCMGNFPEGLGGEQELRRDRFFTNADHLFRIYLDNYDELLKIDRKLAVLLQGTPSKTIEELRKAYMEAGLPRRPKKAVSQEFQAEVQGAWINGITGTCGAKPSKILKYMALTLQLVFQGNATQRELQVVCGGLVYIAMFRRPLLSGLNAVWRAIVACEGKPTQWRIPLPKPVVKELVRFVGLVSLAVMDFRAAFDKSVSASDASTTGGGLVVSRGLSPFGQAASLSTVRGDLPEAHDFCQVLCVGLFDGISGLRCAMDALGLPIAGHISVEQSEAANRVVESFFQRSSP